MKYIQTFENFVDGDLDGDLDDDLDFDKDYSSKLSNIINKQILKISNWNVPEIKEEILIPSFIDFCDKNFNKKGDIKWYPGNFTYTEYLGEQMKNSISYTEYLGEQMKNVVYYEKY